MKISGVNLPMISGLAVVIVTIVAVCAVGQSLLALPPVFVWTGGAIVVAVVIGNFVLVSRTMTSGASCLSEAVATAAADRPVSYTGVVEPGTLCDALQELTDNLARYKGLCEGIIGGLPMPFLLVDTEERTLHTNQATLDMLQIDGPVDKQLGRTLAEIFYNDGSRETAVGKAMNKGQVFRNLEVAIQGHKGGTRHVLANVYALNNSRGECIGGFCLYLDMTTLKEKETEIREQSEMIIRTADRADSISDQLASASEEISAQVEESSRATEESRKLTASVAVSVEQMNATVLEVARNAANAADVSDKARHEAEDGQRIVAEVIADISSLEEQASKLSEDMDALGKQADSIGNIMGVISDIADQTNLLALNAAIEAARAGDAGRGFAVVADEVRKLAEKTMDATKNVEDNIRAIQVSAESNVTATKDTVRVVGETVETTKLAGKALTTIVDLSGQTSQNVQSIATAAEEQSAASEEIARSAGDINVAADETSRAMHESAIAVTDLARLASDLRETMNDMRLPGNG